MYLRFLFSFILLARSICGDELDDLIHEQLSDVECLTLIRSDNIEPNTFKASHISGTIRKGFWECAREILLKAQESGLDIRNTLDLEGRWVMKEIAALKSLIGLNKPMSVITPAFQWAQSPKEIFINVKFAHKIDAPATLNVEASNVTLLNNMLYLEASDKKKKFILEMEFLRGIQVNESSWNMGSVGRMVFTLKKADSPSKWTRLLFSRVKLPNMHHWWEIQEKYRDDLDKIIEDGIDEDSAAAKKKKEAKAAVENSEDELKNITATEEVVPSDMPSEPTLTIENQAKIDKISEDLKVEIKALEVEKRKKKKEWELKLKEDKKILDLDYKTRIEALKTKAEEEISTVKGLTAASNATSDSFVLTPQPEILPTVDEESSISATNKHEL